MPRTTVPAAATSLPSRRTALASLAGLGTTLALPNSSKAAALATNSISAELTTRYTAAHRRWVVALAEQGEAEMRVVDP